MTTSTSTGTKIKHALRLYHALKLVWQAGPGRAILSTVLIIIQSVLPVITLYLIKLIVDAVTFSISAPDQTAAFKQVIVLIGLTAGIALLQAFCQLAANLVREAQSFHVTDYVTNIIHEKSIDVDLAYYENPDYFNKF